MTTADLESVATIESENPSPWTAGQLASERDQDGGWQFVAELGASGLVCGFVCGRSCVGEAELLKIAVGREYRRQGIAAQLVAHTLCSLAEQGVGRCFLELRVANTPALALYERFGFLRVGLRRNYYASPQEDAILMERIVLSAQ
ncbi:MAG: ribosomal protein S18-alanine N-acetyltransferase [Desulfurivibrionaceae bacterium]|jgi:ribosomal-protein-alanine N-acetyltransferase